METPPHLKYTDFRINTIRDSIDSFTFAFWRQSEGPRKGLPVYDVWRVRRRCEEIAIEQDIEKAEDLIKLLSAVIREKDEEIVFNLGSFA